MTRLWRLIALLAFELIQFRLQQVSQQIGTGIFCRRSRDDECRCTPYAERRAAFMIETHSADVRTRLEATAESIRIQANISAQLDQFGGGGPTLVSQGKDRIVHGPELIVALVQRTLGDFGCPLALFRHDDWNVAIDEIHLPAEFLEDLFNDALLVPVFAGVTAVGAVLD